MITHHHHRSINVPVRNHLVDPSMFLPVNVSCQLSTYRGALVSQGRTATARRRRTMRCAARLMTSSRCAPNHINPIPKAFSNGRLFHSFFAFDFSTFDFRVHFRRLNPKCDLQIEAKECLCFKRVAVSPFRLACVFAPLEPQMWPFCQDRFPSL